MGRLSGFWSGNIKVPGGDGIDISTIEDQNQPWKPEGRGVRGK
jgi:hypothetical protein